MKIKSVVLTVLTLCILTVPAMADVDVSGNNGEVTLQDIFNAMTVSPASGSSIIAATDMLSDTTDSYWEVTGTDNSTASFVIEIAGNSAINTFGIYDRFDETKYLEVFAGGASTGNYSVIHVDGNVFTVTQFSAGSLVVGQYQDTFASSQFGFYLGRANGPLFYSDSDLNGGNDQMVAYAGNDSDRVDIEYNIHGGASSDDASVWTSREYVLAWEDVLLSGSDSDYNDFVVMVESINPVPVPAAVLLGALGLGAAGLRLRKRG